MTRVLTDHAYVTGTTNDLALLTHGLDACANFHDFSLELSNRRLLVAVGNAAARHVVRSDLHLDLVPGENTDAVLTHTTRTHCEHGKSVF